MGRQLANEIKKQKDIPEQLAKSEVLDAKLGQFHSYKKKRAAIKEMKKHYDNTFELTIEG